MASLSLRMFALLAALFVAAPAVLASHAQTTTKSFAYTGNGDLGATWVGAAGTWIGGVRLNPGDVPAGTDSLKVSINDQAWGTTIAGRVVINYGATTQGYDFCGSSATIPLQSSFVWIAIYPGGALLPPAWANPCGVGGHAAGAVKGTITVELK